MASPRAILLAIAITALLLVHGVSTKGGADLDLEEDLSFLEEAEDDVGGYSFPGSDDAFPEYTGDEADDEEELDHEGFAESDHDAPPAIDETDVVVLTDTNFSDFVGKRPHVMVEFYAPWCGHCQALAPEYAASATALRGEDVALAKVDATEENELAQKYEIQGFPTVLFFVDGVHKDYPGQRTKNAIVTWIKKKIGPGIQNITSIEEAEKILIAENKVVLGFFDSLVVIAYFFLWHAATHDILFEQI